MLKNKKSISCTNISNIIKRFNIKYFYAFVVPLCIFFIAFKTADNEADFIKKNFNFASVQINDMLGVTVPPPLIFPRTINKMGKTERTDMFAWTSGFFTGSLWYTYEFTKDPELKKEAIAWTEKSEPLKTYTKSHDIGFMMNCSFGNAYRITGNKAYKNVLVESAKSLSTRFNPITGTIKSWNSFKSLHGDKTYYFPVIIDNMMNLELLFLASKITGDTSFSHIAISHANKTMQNHIRENYSSFHVVCYDTLTGKVLAQETGQGYSDNSTWARGQAWGIYGFTMCYRETKNPAFLKTALGMAKWFLNNNLTADKIPYWDFNANQAGYTPGINSKAKNTTVLLRDASAAAITASALLELSTYTGNQGKEYRAAAVQILHSLASPAYLATPGENGNFILEHSVGSIPSNSEIDVPLVYADYYFLEALQRYSLLLKGKNIFVND